MSKNEKEETQYESPELLSYGSLKERTLDSHLQPS